MGKLTKYILWTVLCVSLAACSHLPRGAAIQAEVIKGADEPEADFAVYPVSKAFLPSVAEWPRTGERHYGWLPHSHGSNAQIIRPGDTLNVVIWDSAENSLLLAPGERNTNLANLRVSESGSIFIPYVGKVRVAERTPDSARLLLQRQLESVAPGAQVQLTMAEGRTNSIDMVSGVKSPGNLKLPDQDFSVLAAISAAGGVNDALSNPQVKLIRGHKTYRTSLKRLFDNPKLDTRLKGGDRVIVEKDPRYFLSLGAADSENQFDFNRDKISALDAMSIIGGVTDARANPKGVLVLREYPASALTSGQRGPRQQRVVFTIDLTTSDGLFSAKNFYINSGDLVLATESPVSNVRTIVGLIGSAFGLINTATN
ncbi:polysaccharide biosynthesis/export family protein [Sulfitobacter donghicola]|uniref:Polysaccharide biosynthesis protein n=1 Tax=Sulfitobacter donghicola DSW-25 = KCTC 12864 = JCM 14565 TaxID=1300350 RepID=A0A073IK86_9RHOB|nr:polysaccharide biosynthesis/export family protein [Sulfitobacter donghicola]KEJ90738.1 polysaccharide biosynthesis protein [Sulfitobacter donghicola DSW-25 = KCTC 12864 = JCM 14565]KIN67994.1 putative capsule polysaccharide exporter [Sulfitobacter donghicola DSW-25 = KCTC 12864 = JCM 14565]